MDLIPAIDLLDGSAVRLVQGDYARHAASVPDPAAVITGWVRAGVRWLHLVDLGGARAGRPMDLPLVRTLVGAIRDARPEARIELGGGLRRVEDIDAAFDAGIDVAILGTAAIEDPALLRACVERWPGRIAVSLDVRGGHLAVDGWTRTARGEPVRLASEVAASGIAHLIVTDVDRDGTGRGANRRLLARMREAIDATPLVAAGGIGSVDDLRALAGIGIDGAVVGLALVDGSMSIGDALAATVPETGAA